MTNEQKMKEIEKKIMDEMNAFNNTTYEGGVFKGFKALFEKALMSVPLGMQKAPVSVLKGIVVKKEHSLTYGDVSVAMNIIRAVKLSELNADIHKALEILFQLEGLSIDFNVKYKRKQELLNEKKANMIALAGVNLNGSKVISIN